MKKIEGALILLSAISLAGCGEKQTFNEQIKNDVETKMTTGICDSIPLGARITDIVIGEIVPIGETGLIDVSLAFEVEAGSGKKHHENAMLYSKSGNTYKLEAIGGCEYKN